MADDDVIVHRDAEQLAHLGDFLGHLDIGRRRHRIAGGISVDQDQCRAADVERPPDHLARIERSVVDSSRLLQFVGDELVLTVEKENAKLFGLAEGQAGFAVVVEGVPQAQHRTLHDAPVQQPVCRRLRRL